MSNYHLNKPQLQTGPLHVDTINWETWRPTEFATLCFIIRNESILLIRKKTGLGAGKINGPGGRLKKGETETEGAIRETQEEIGVTPLGIEYGGKLFFQFTDGYKLNVTVFAANNCSGQLKSSEEADPLWTDLHLIPYHEMWQDDPHWLPLVIQKKRFLGYFVFDKEELLSFKVSEI